MTNHSLPIADDLHSTAGKYDNYDITLIMMLLSNEYCLYLYNKL